MSAPTSTFVTRLDGPAPEREVARHLVRTGLVATPVLVLACLLGWGWGGALSSAYGVAIVLVNFLFSAFLISSTARITLGLMMGAVLFGYVARLGLLWLAVYAVLDTSWIRLWPLGLTLIVTHLGLLFWELRFVSASLAFPGLKPRPAAPAGPRSTTKDGR